MLPTYTIITKGRVHKTDSDTLYEEQKAKCEEVGIDLGFFGKERLIHYFDSPFMVTEWDPIYDAIQILAIKDGVDLVQFSNGNYGFVAYYSGIKNGFEILE